MTYEYLRSRPQLLEFIRQQPKWYRYLSRYGLSRMNDLEKEAKIYYGKTLSGRLNRMNEHVQMASMLINLTHLLKD